MILLWRITTRCNFACGFCAYDKRLAGARHAVDPAEVERIAHLAVQMARANGQPLLLSWLGGEPLLWPPLLELSERLARLPGLALSMTSNGTRLADPAVVRAVVRDFAEVTLSIDGPADLHDRLRGAPGSFARAQAAVAALIAARRAATSALKLRINVVVMRDTLPYFAKLCRMLADWGVDEITFNQLGGRDRPEFFADQRLSVADAGILAAQVPALQTELGTVGVRLCSSPAYLRRIEASSRDEPLPVADCHPGEDFLFIDELGRIAPCSFTGAQYGIPIAGLRAVSDVAALPRLLRQARLVQPASVCQDCPSTQYFGKFAA